MAETRRCSASTRAGRMAKARQFLVAAETLAKVIDDQEIADAFVTQLVSHSQSGFPRAGASSDPGTTTYGRKS